MISHAPLFRCGAPTPTQYIIGTLIGSKLQCWAKVCCEMMYGLELRDLCTGWGFAKCYRIRNYQNITFFFSSCFPSISHRPVLLWCY